MFWIFTRFKLEISTTFHVSSSSPLAFAGKHSVHDCTALQGRQNETNLMIAEHYTRSRDRRYASDCISYNLETALAKANFSSTPPKFWVAACAAAAVTATGATPPSANKFRLNRLPTGQVTVVVAHELVPHPITAVQRLFCTFKLCSC